MKTPHLHTRPSAIRLGALLGSRVRPAWRVLAMATSFLGSAVFAGNCNEACPPDLDFSDMVDGGDLGILLAEWGSTTSCANFDLGATGVDGADIGILLAAWGACAATSCQGTETCCDVHASPGCDDQACCDSICAGFPTCCTSGWDQSCVNLAVDTCDICPLVRCPASGDCCAVHLSSGCDDAACCEAVCDSMVACCQDGWDQVCVTLAESICAICDGEPACPGSADCCTVHVGPGCSDASCCELVCGQDPACCSDGWDQACVNAAVELCTICFGGPECPGVGDCCAPHIGNGCSDASCCESVCFSMPECCQAGWDQSCVAVAESVCPECDPQQTDCPGVGDCCAVHSQNGCSIESCCDSVCFSMLACCETGWDSQCVDLAESLCDACMPGSSCPGSGDCCEVHVGNGCNIESCCESVCFSMLECCESGWDQQCVSIAESVCGICN